MPAGAHVQEQARRMIVAIIIACALVGLVHGLWALEAHMETRMTRKRLTEAHRTATERNEP